MLSQQHPIIVQLSSGALPEQLQQAGNGHAFALPPRNVQYDAAAVHDDSAIPQGQRGLQLENAAAAISIAYFNTSTFKLVIFPIHNRAFGRRNERQWYPFDLCAICYSSEGSPEFPREDVRIGCPSHS